MLVLAAGGLFTGAVAGSVLARVLVPVLKGVFDPPPSTVTVPWTYLVVTAGVGALAVAAETAVRHRGRSDVELLREV